MKKPAFWLIRLKNSSLLANLKRLFALVFLWLPCSAAAGIPANLSGGALDSQRFRIIISSDIGGNDNDDFQSIVHLLVYADMFDIEGLISSPPCGGRKQDILDVLDEYEKDYPNLSTWGDYPTANELRAITYQGAIDAQSGTVPSSLSTGAQRIIDCANAGDSRPLYVLVWGSITDVAQAVHESPSIKSKIRIYSIGSWNTWQDQKARDYLFNNHQDLWWIENDQTFRGMYTGGIQTGDLENTRFVSEHVNKHGFLGNFYYSKKTDIKMGDTPSLLYIMRGDPGSPETEHWGGMFEVRDPATRPTHWQDRSEEVYKEGNRLGAKTVNVWRENYLRDWQTRMDHASKPNGGPADNPPVTNAGSDITVTDTNENDGEAVKLDGTASTDDNGISSYIWMEGTNTLGTGATPF